MKNENNIQENIVSIQFWKGFSASIPIKELNKNAIPVKGQIYKNPYRFLEIYCNYSNSDFTSNRVATNTNSVLHYSEIKYFDNWNTIDKLFMPRINNSKTLLGENIYQPPFVWKDSNALNLCLSFSYNTNAFYRILKYLAELKLIQYNQIDSLLDYACVILSALYKFNDNFIMRNMNNTFNMYLISKVIEIIVGKKIYNSDFQELTSTSESLKVSLSFLNEIQNLNIMDKIGTSIAQGVTFIESKLATIKNHGSMNGIKDISYKYYKKKLAIDDRSKLFELIEKVGNIKGSFKLTVILDDASESVIDFVWLQDILTQYPFLKIHLLVNTAQISINFSSHMLNIILTSIHFKKLSEYLNNQLMVDEIYCPFISFQYHLLPRKTQKTINNSDAIFIKGANFFETCQIFEKDTFYAFVVYGPISRQYTGLDDYDAVFVHVPQMRNGYIHHKDPYKIASLTKLHNNLFE